MSEPIPVKPGRSAAHGNPDSLEDALTEAGNHIQNRNDKLDALRREIQIGMNDIKAGRVSLLDMDNIRRRGRLRLQLEQPGRQEFS